MITNYISHTIKGREEVRDAPRLLSNVPDEFFRELDPTEEQEFRQWARDNFAPGRHPSGLWHPIVRQEWQKLQGEYEGEGWQVKGGQG